MKLDTLSIQRLDKASEVVRGNVYPAKGGKGDTMYWLVISTTETGAHLIGFDPFGCPVSTASYNKHALRDRPVLGHVDLSPILLKLVK